MSSWRTLNDKDKHSNPKVILLWPWMHKNHELWNIIDTFLFSMAQLLAIIKTKTHFQKKNEKHVFLIIRKTKVLCAKVFHGGFCCCFVVVVLVLVTFSWASLQYRKLLYEFPCRAQFLLTHVLSKIMVLHLSLSFKVCTKKFRTNFINN